MAWNEPGGGKKDPWKSDDRGGNNAANDVDAFLNRLKSGFGRVFGGGRGGGRARGGDGPGGGWIWIVVAVLAIWVVFDSWQMIDERERGVVLRFGKAHRIMQPGPNLKWPRPIERVIKVEATQVRSTTDQVRMLTRDENIVIIDFNVQYRVVDPQLFLFGSHNPEETLQQAAESAVREVMGGTDMDTILTGERAQLAIDARTKLQGSLEAYRTGLEVTEFNLQNARPPAEVKDAFDDAISAREDKQRIENEARAYASTVVPEARGSASRVLQEAQGYKEATIAAAEGDAARFTLLQNEYRAAPEVTRRRLYLETIEDVLARNGKVLIDDENGNNVIYLPLDRAGGSGDGGAVSRLREIQQSLPVVTGATERSDDPRSARDTRRLGRDGGGR